MKRNIDWQEEESCRLAFIFIAGGSQAHLANMKAQQEACFANLPKDVRCLWLVADEEVNEVKLEDSTLYIPIMDVYENLLEKTVIGINWVLANWSPDYIIRSNTSNYFNLRALDLFFEQASEENLLYGGVRGTAKVQILGNEQVVTYVSGSGIYLSSLMARELVQIDHASYLEVVEDVAIGMYLSNRGFSITEIPRNDVTDWNPLEFGLQLRIKAWHSDDLTLKRFKEISRMLKQSGLRRNCLYVFFELKEVVRGLLARQVAKSIMLAWSIPSSTFQFIAVSRLINSKYSSGVPQSK